jgi:hypothetical protein
MSGWGHAETHEHRMELIRLLAKDSRSVVRKRVAETLGTIPGRRLEELEELILQFTTDPSREVREAAAGSLGRILHREVPAAAEVMFNRFAGSSESLTRQAAANALAGSVTDSLALEGLRLLALDWVADVRESVAETARDRLASNPEGFLRILQNLSKDNARNVRFAALDGLHRACNLGLTAGSIPWLEDGVLSEDLPTAKKAAAILAVAAERDPDSVLSSYDHIAGRPDLTEPEVLAEMVVPILKLAISGRTRARRILHRLTFHNHDAVSGPALAGLGQLDT